MKRYLFLFSLFGLSFLMMGRFSQAMAFSFRTSDNIIVSSEEVIDGSFFAAGENILIQGEIDGDLYCAGKSIRITGTVHGDVLCAGQFITLEGTVDGNVRTAGQMIELSSDVTRNITAAGQDVHMSEDFVTEGEVFAAGSSVVLDGVIGRDALLYGKSVSANGAVHGDLEVKAQTFSIGTLASVDGSTSYTGEVPAVVAEGAELATPLEQTQIEKPERKTEEQNNFSLGSAIWKIVSSTIAMFVLGWILHRKFPHFLSHVTTIVLKEGVGSGVKGALILILGPFVVIAIFLTIVGIPIALLLLLLWLAGILLSGVFTANVLGSILSGKLNKRVSGFNQELLLGSLVLSILFILPYLGWIIGLISLSLGMGALWKSFFDSKKSRE